MYDDVDCGLNNCLVLWEYLKAVTVAISCIRTIHADQMPHLLRFLLLSATPVNAGRIISQIREQLKFVGVVDPRAVRSKKLKGKASANSTTDGAILDALRSGLRFKNVGDLNLHFICNAALHIQVLTGLCFLVDADAL